MRVLFATPSFPPMLGGGARYAGALAAQLAQHGHRVTVLTSQARSEADFWRRKRASRGFSEERQGAVRVIRCPCAGVAGGRASLMTWRKAMVLLSALPGDRSRLLMRMARRVPSIPTLASALSQLDDHDLVHGFNLSWEYPLLAGWRYSRRRGLAFVVTPFAHLGVGANDRVARNNTMDHQLRILVDADAVLALTSVERNGLMRYGLSPERVFVVGGGSDPKPPPLADKDLPEDVLQRHGLSTPIVLFVGRINRDKGALDAAKAVRRLFRSGLVATLVLVGEADSEFRRYHRQLATEERQLIRPLGEVEETEKHELLSASSMLVLPSRVDSFGLVLLEAWTHGKPVIGARAGGIPGVIAEGQDGLLVTYGDVQELAEAMALLLRDEQLARALGRRGQRKLRTEYSWESVYDRVSAAYAFALTHARSAVKAVERR